MNGNDVVLQDFSKGFYEISGLFIGKLLLKARVNRMIGLNAFKKGIFALGLVSFYSLTVSPSIGMERKNLEEKGTTKSPTSFIIHNLNPRERRSLSLLPISSSHFEGPENQLQTQNQTLSAKYSSSPRPQSSPRRSPRPRCSSSTNPLSLEEPSSSPLELLGISVMRSITPRALRLNDYIEERFEEMGKSASETPIDLCCKKFYQKFKGQENEPSLAFQYEWQNDTKKSPLDQFWNYSVMEYLSDDKIQKFDKKNLEVIGSSVIFLIEELKEKSHPDFEILCSAACAIYRHLSEKLSKKLNIASEDVSKEACFYHIAKYSTLMKSFAEAWPLLTQCVALLDWDDEEEVKWISHLKDGYLNYLKSKETREASRYEEFFKVASFLQLMKAHAQEVTDNENNPLDCEIINTCLEGAKDLYCTNLSSEQKLEEIKKLSPSVLLPLARAAYRSSQAENEANAKTLLTISHNCFNLLSQDILGSVNKNYLSQMKIAATFKNPL